MKNIVLIGMSGVGKTQKGRYIARRMNRDFIDTDAAIVESQDLTIDDIFQKYGELYFRNIEEQMIEKVSKLDNTVIATGGGIVLRSSNIAYLKQNGFIVYLKADVDTITNNLSYSKTVRPLLKQNPDLYQSVYDLYKSREDLYQSCGDITIDIDKKSMELIYNQVIVGYNEYITCDK